VGKIAAAATTAAMTASFFIDGSFVLKWPPQESGQGKNLRGSGHNSDRTGELTAQPHEKGLERQPRREVELLEGAPGLADELACPLGAGEPLGRAVGGQLLEPVVMDDRTLGADRNGDEVAVPGRELLERGEQLLALGAALRAPNALLGLARGEIERLALLLGVGLRFGATLARALEDPRGRIGGLELRVGIDAPCDLEQRVATRSGRRIEQPRHAVEASGGDTGERRRLVRLQTRGACADLLADRAPGQPPERHELAA